LTTPRQGLELENFELKIGNPTKNEKTAKFSSIIFSFYSLQQQQKAKLDYNKI